jgi:acyl-CoA reductase-like NAD-dependent aldehyde dehydrogenase
MPNMVSYTVREPMGVVAAITPGMRHWCCWLKLLPALAAATRW